MANPANFEGSDQTYTDQTYTAEPEEIKDLPTKTVPHGDGVVVWSCWELAPAEIAEIINTGRVWLGCLNIQPAVIITGNRPEELDHDSKTGPAEGGSQTGSNRIQPGPSDAEVDGNGGVGG